MNRTTGAKILLSAVIFIVSAGAIRADEITTINGKKYSGATITRAEPDGLVITYSAGIVKVPFTELSEDWQKRYGYDPEMAQKFADDKEFRDHAYKAKVEEDKAALAAKNAGAWKEQQRVNRLAETRKAIRTFTLEANEVGTMSDPTTTWKTDYGSTEVHTEENKKIRVAVHDVGGNSAICQVSIYFVGRSLTHNLRMVYARADAQLRVDHGMESKTELVSPSLHSSVLTLRAIGETLADGAVMEGWIAVGRIDGQRFGLKASNGDVAPDAERLIAQYEEARKVREDTATR